MRFCSGQGTSTPPKDFTRDLRSVKLRRRLRNFPRHDGLRRLAAAQIEDHGGGDLDAVGHEGRIDAALEAVAGIGLDAELAAGRGGAQRIEKRSLEEHVDRLRRAARLHRRP